MYSLSFKFLFVLFHNYTQTSWQALSAVV